MRKFLYKSSSVPPPAPPRPPTHTDINKNTHLLTHLLIHSPTHSWSDWLHTPALLEFVAAQTEVSRTEE